MNSIKDPECMVAVVKQLIFYENYNENHLALKACAEMLTIRRITHTHSIPGKVNYETLKFQKKNTVLIMVYRWCLQAIIYPSTQRP